MVAEIDYWKSVIGGFRKPTVPIVPYVPVQRMLPPKLLDVFSAWKGIESILGDLITRFSLETGSCLEFGVERGYSTSALAYFFDSVTGVDTFLGDKHTNERTDLYESTKDRLSDFNNIHLIRSNYQDWITRNDGFYDLIHVDIIHTYIDTYNCGLWSAKHSRCVIFHDTESFPAVKQAVTDIARETQKTFYNFGEFYGLGILV